MLDWDDLRFFQAVTRTGSLSAAARELRCTQTTVGRRLASLEARLGVRLLNRTPRGYVATPAGESIREHVERIEAEASAVEHIVAGRDARLEGKVTVTCIESIANNILAPCFAALHRDYPEVVIELLPPDRHVSLARRESDISIHHVRPKHQEIIVRRIGSIAFGVYASPDYLERFGMPNFADGCAGHRVLSLPDQFCDLPQMRWLADLTHKSARRPQDGQLREPPPLPPRRRRHGVSAPLSWRRNAWVDSDRRDTHTGTCGGSLARGPQGQPECPAG